MGAALVLLSACASEQAPSRAQLQAFIEEMPPTGEAVTYFALTHCGLEHLRIGGHWWHAEEPLEGEVGSAPTGWDDPFQKGRLTVESAQRAVFEAQGDEVVFLRAATDEEPVLCR